MRTVPGVQPVFMPPFTALFRWDDAHVIAYLEGHPEYEAVEAFVARRPEAPALVRAILTRHDKAQIDHLNDAGLVRSQRASAPGRPAVCTEVSYAETRSGDMIHARLGFQSFRGERVVLELTPATPATAAFGGLTDPEGHAPEVLPILWRDASALAAQGTTVTIDDVPYGIPRFEVGPGVKAFRTEGFAVGIVPSQERSLRVIEMPPAVVAGARWRFREADDEVLYEIAEARSDRVVIRRRSGSADAIEAVARDGRLDLVSLRIQSASERTGELVFRCAPCLCDAARFAIDIDTHPDLVTGRVQTTDDGFVVIPDTPAWARSRPVHVSVRTVGDMRTVRTVVGQWH